MRWIRAAIQTQLNWLQKLMGTTGSVAARKKKINGSPPKTVPLFVLKLDLQQKLGLPATTPMGSTSGDVEGQNGVTGADISTNSLSIMGQQCTHIP